MQKANTVSLVEIRDREFPVVKEYTYLNTAAQGPWPTRTVRAVEERAALAQYPNTPRAKAAPWNELEARSKLAQLINARAEDIVFTGNTTHGINIAAQGIDWREGDNLVIPAREFPSLDATWSYLATRGVEVRHAPWTGAGPTVDGIMGLVDARTRAVTCSVIKWDTGYRIDLDELGKRCADRGCLLIVDGIQSVGAERFDVRASRVSAMSTHGYKWLMAGFGIGALYVAPEAVDQIKPVFVGYQSIEGAGNAFDGNFVWKEGAARYAMGGGNQMGQTALIASLSLIEEIGIGTIEEQNRTLSEMLVAGLKQKGMRLVSSENTANRSQVTVFTLGSQAQDAALVEALEKQGILVALRPLGVRVSPNFYNNESDIARLLDAIR